MNTLNEENSIVAILDQLVPIEALLNSFEHIFRIEELDSDRFRVFAHDLAIQRLKCFLCLFASRESDLGGAAQVTLVQAQNCAVIFFEFYLKYFAIVRKQPIQITLCKEVRDICHKK